MDMPQKRHETHAVTPTSGGPDESGNPSLQDMHAAAQHFLKAGSDAIDRALSRGKSEEFLVANRQAGGE
jgi:hypothetical protein